MSGQLLLGQLNFSLVSSGDGVGLLSNVELDVAVGSQVWRNSTVGSVSSSPSLNGSLGSNVSDLALLSVETLGFSVGLKVLEESDNVFDRFLWESSVVVVDIFAHSLSRNATLVSSEWNNGLVIKDSLEILNSLVQVHSSDSSSSLASVFVVGSQVINSAFSS